MCNCIKILMFLMAFFIGCSKKSEQNNTIKPSPSSTKNLTLNNYNKRVSVTEKKPTVLSPLEKRMERLIAFLNRIGNQSNSGAKKLLDRISLLEKGERVSFRDLKELLNLMERNLFDLIRSHPDLNDPYREYLKKLGEFLDIYSRCIILYSLPEDAPDRPQDNRWKRKLVIAYNNAAQLNNSLKGIKAFKDTSVVPKDPLDPNSYYRKFKQQWLQLKTRAFRWVDSHPLVPSDAVSIPAWMRYPRREKVNALFMQLDGNRDFKWLGALKCKPHVGKAPKGSKTCKDTKQLINQGKRIISRFNNSWVDGVQELIDIEPQIPSAMEEKLNPLFQEIKDFSKKIK